MAIKYLFITANVGSIFQDPEGLLKSWIREFLKTVNLFKPNFIALHFQEFGGKNYRKAHRHNCVDDFVRTLISSHEMNDFHSIRVFLDEDFSSEDKFTALGSFYFVDKTQEAFIWNFHTKTFVPTTGKEIHSGSIESVPIVSKVKFPQEFFPECKWSRKGFMRTRWLMTNNGTTIFDTINIHLFHDESNFVSISEFPSQYAKNRRKALEYTLNTVKQDDDFRDLPLFIFGDFNFRLDLNRVIERLTVDSKLTQKKNKNGDLIRLFYHDGIQGKVLSIERKQFVCSDQDFFIDPNNQSWLLEQDKELCYFDGKLSEFEKCFLPSYPFEENNNHAHHVRYMNTRCPSWCDRVLMNNAAKTFVLNNNKKNQYKYDIMGIDSPMGDHKPVFLYFELLSNKSDEVSQQEQQQQQQMNGSIGNRYNNRAMSNSSGSKMVPEQVDDWTTIKNYFYYNQQSQQSKTSNFSTVPNNSRVYVFKETQI